MIDINTIKAADAARLSPKAHLSPEQADFFDFVETTGESVVLEACAGSGKTTALVPVVNMLCQKYEVAACAFNKRNADELGEKMPDATCKTLNSFGHGAWAKFCKSRIRVDRDKMYKILRYMMNQPDFVWKDRPNKEAFTDMTAAKNLAIKMKTVGYFPEGSKHPGRSLVPTGYDTIEELSFQYEIEPFNESIANMAEQILIMSIDKAMNAEIDFDDQLYMTCCLDAPMPKFDIVVVDEAQDISGIQRELISRMGPRIIAAGDRHQAIYAFRGASYTSMDDFKRDFDATPMPLSQSFRCPQDVVKESRRFVGHIYPVDSAPRGSVSRRGLDWSPAEFKPTDAVVCRNNKPLVELAMKLLRAQVPCTVLGRDIGKSLKTFIKKFDYAKDVEEFIILAEAALADEVKKLMTAGKLHRIEPLEDKIGSIVAIAEAAESVEQISEIVDKIFEARHNCLTLSTIHRSKGGEWQRVWFLEPNLLPSKWAKQESAIEQEMNLAYVGITRAKEELIYINLPSDKEPDNTFFEINRFGGDL